MLIGDLGFGVKCADKCAVLLDHHQLLEELDISCSLGFMLTMFCRSSLLLSAQFNYLCNPINLFLIYLHTIQRTNRKQNCQFYVGHLLILPCAEIKQIESFCH
jgi:hypothetical protein